MFTDSFYIIIAIYKDINIYHIININIKLIITYKPNVSEFKKSEPIIGEYKKRTHNRFADGKIFPCYYE